MTLCTAETDTDRKGLEMAIRGGGVDPGEEMSLWLGLVAPL